MVMTWQRSLAMGVVCGLIPGVASPAGFQVHGQSTSQMGNAFAGVAASAPDASTVWWNPAGMSFVDGTQVVQVVNLMRTSTEFDNIASAPALGQPLGPEGGNAGTKRIVPALYGQYKINEQWHVGVGVNAPFGLRTVYDGEWMGRFQAQKSQSQSHNVNPSVAWKMSDKLTIGAGVNAQHFDATLTNAVNYTGAVVSAGLATGAIAPAAVPGLVDPAVAGNIAGLEGSARLEGDDWGFGWNLGFIYAPWPDLRVGAHYRSRIRYTLEGKVDFTAPGTTSPLAAPIIAALSAPGGALAAGPVAAHLTVPDTLSMSAMVGRLKNAGDVAYLFDATWFGWSVLNDIAFRRPDGTLLSRLNFQWRDAWRLAAGVSWRYSSQLMLRAGYAWDQTPVDDERTRSPRLPDETRHWFSVGSNHAIPGHKNMTADLALNFVKAKEARIPSRTDGNAAAFGTLDGSADVNSLTISGQLNMRFR